MAFVNKSYTDVLLDAVDRRARKMETLQEQIDALKKAAEKSIKEAKGVVFVDNSAAGRFQVSLEDLVRRVFELPEKTD